MSDLDKIKRMRARRLEVEIPPIHSVHFIQDYELVECKNWYGIRDKENKMLLPPIYDDIEFLEDSNMCILIIRDTCFLYDVLDRKEVRLPKMSSYHTYGDVLVIETEDGVGLYSCFKRKLLIPAIYAETTHVDRGRYLWVKDKDGKFAFFDTMTSAIVRCPEDTSMCVEGKGNLMFVIVDNMVKCLNDFGFFDADLLRKFAIEHGGRIKLSNDNEHISVIADVYGHIIN